MSIFLSMGTLVLTACGSATAPQEVKLDQPAEPVKKAPPEKGFSIEANSGNSWFETTQKDLGTFFSNELAVGVFEFENPTDNDQVFKNLVGSCTCAKAIIRVGDREYELSSKPKPNQLYRINKRLGGEDRELVDQISIAPGEKGEIEVHMQMTGIVGMRHATLDLHTTDPELPMIKLKWRATGATMFVVSPQEVNLNKIRWDQESEFEVRVTSPLAKDFNIVGHDPWPQDFEVEFEKEMVQDKVSWVIRGSYGPVDAGTGGGGVLNFRTDLKGGASFNVRVLAFVEGPLEIKPGGFLTLGMIRKGEGKQERITFEPTGDFDLQATEVKLERLTVDQDHVKVTTSKEGKLLHLDLEILPGIKANTLVRGDIVVHLNHPAMREKRVLFNGFVR